MVISNTDAPQVVPIDDINTFTKIYFGNALALMKLRQKGASKANKVARGVFRRILEYYEPVCKMKVTEHYKYNPEYPTNYTWP